MGKAMAIIYTFPGDVWWGMLIQTSIASYIVQLGQAHCSGECYLAVSQLAFRLNGLHLTNDGNDEQSYILDIPDVFIHQETSELKS